MGYSLGIINKSLRELVLSGYLNEKMTPTLKLKKMMERKKSKHAIILAAGFGMRMIPINMETPKGLLEVKKEPLIERIIRQLHEVEIYSIYIVVGFMKEKYEYLIDEYGVNLIVNPEYAEKNNLYSLKKALPYKVIEINTYEQLRDLDNNSNHLQSEAIRIIEDTFQQVEGNEIRNIDMLKKGMTNRAFIFECYEKKYIMRIPGEGTDKLINRKQEAKVYAKINCQGICDRVVYMNPQNGYKTSSYKQFR